MSIERFFGHDINFDLAMKPFTWQHFMLIMLGILTVAVTFYFAKRIRQSKYEKHIKYGFAFWLIFLELIYHFHYWGYGLFSVPLHVCSFGVFFSVLILFSDNKKIYDFLFFIGILGGLLALFIPNTLGYTYYNMRYYHFILLHMSIAAVPIYYFRAYGFRVNKRSVGKTIALLIGLFPIVSYVNYTFKKNYMFIGEKPDILANILPDWPYFLIIYIVLMPITLYALYLVSALYERKFD
jgi:hypothetical integral membrane protein (TIGR02206 family)